ncbi:MAG TPA: metallophosphoesterase family protein [Candidatus Acidoferrum sp.]|nr:metallophosphoesterase family protein [Candidatus Acidoferrum sp.]
MRLAILSDIHSNLAALDAVLRTIEADGPVDGVRVLGDVVGYGPEPDEVVERLRGAGATGVHGNHDLAALGGDLIEWFNPDARAAVEWTMKRISPTTREWLAGLPERFDDGAFTLVHGSPRDPIWEYILTPAVARENLVDLPTPHCLFGHTHLPIAYRQAGERMATVNTPDGSVVELDERRTFLNPGSVGQPRDGITSASWLLLDTDALTATWRRTEYDIARTQAAMREVGLPTRLIARLAVGA